MNYFNVLEIKHIINHALKEDIGRKDITTEFCIPNNKKIKAFIVAKENCIACGLGVAATVFKTFDNRINFKSLVKDGFRIAMGKKIAVITGNAKSIITAERVALNFLILLCGISTKTREYVNAVKPYKVRILDTRKTIPGLRILEKYAVRIGGGFNHRSSLDEMILAKDNHIKIIGNYTKLRDIPKGYQAELEVENLKEFRDALKVYPDIIMLDNMPVADVKKAVRIRNKLSISKTNPKPKLEASGGINLKNIKKYAATGVDMISIGALTHSISSVDISLEII